MTRLLLDSSAYIAFKKRHPEVIETLPQAEEILYMILALSLGNSIQRKVTAL
jgi:hypothetical protein